MPAAASPRPIRHARQRGAAGIEFALLFIPFFALFYAAVSYGLTFVLLEGMTHAAQEGARRALRVDTLAELQPTVEARIDQALEWVPTVLRGRIVTDVGAPQPDGRIIITVSYPGYAANPPVPLLVLPGIGSVPQVPVDLVSRVDVYPGVPFN